jgi:hypothetical protein
MMKKFREYVKEELLKEDLSGALVEPKSNASQEAKKLNLTYVGFGRYEDSTGQVSHVVQNDKLIPFQTAVKSQSYKTLSGDDFGEYAKNLQGDISSLHNELTNAYSPENYDNSELDAIKAYTDNQTTTTIYDISQKLASLPVGIPANKIQPEYDGDNRPEIIAALDSAIDKVKAPLDFTAYATLNGELDITLAKKLTMKSFTSATVDASVALQSGDPIMLQIRVSKGSNGVYADDYSSVPGEGEFIFKRGSVLEIVSGPHKIAGSHSESQDMNKAISLYICNLAK